MINSKLYLSDSITVEVAMWQLIRSKKMYDIKDIQPAKAE
jgi:hypothetical protein